MRMHASSLLVATSLCAMHLPSHCDDLFFKSYLFYLSWSQQFVFEPRLF